MASGTSLGRNLKFAFRQLRQTPIVSGVALLSLALGIGANVAIFSLVNALILKALPVHEPERLVQLQLTHPNGRNHKRRSRIHNGSICAITRPSLPASRLSATRDST